MEYDSPRTHESVWAQFDASSPTQLSANVEPNKLEGKHCGAGHMATARVSAYPRGFHALTRKALASTGLLTTGVPGWTRIWHASSGPGL